MRHVHPSDEELLLRSDDALGRRRRSQVDAHLQACPACRHRALQIEADLVTLLGAEDMPPANHHDTHHAWARQRLEAGLAANGMRESRTGVGATIRRLAHEGVSTRSVRWQAGLAAAAALALCSWVWLPIERGATAGPHPDGPARPIRELTPGAAREVSLQAICDGGAAITPAVPPDVRRAVVRAYGMERLPADQYELDYLITPQLGGLPDARNVWPEPYDGGTWNAFVKDQIEDRLSQLVCRGEVDLRTAQRELADDWIAAYRKYFKANVPIRTSAHAGPSAATGL